MASAAAPAASNHRPAIRVSVCGRSHTGRVRPRNEDRISIGAWRSDRPIDQRESRHRLGEQPLLLAVADGMGGYLGGEVASHCVLHRLQTTHWDGIRDAAIREALTRAADDLRDHAQRVPTLALMGATVAGALLDNDQLLHFNVGDSRIYRWRQGVLSQLSTDDRVSGSSRLTQALTASAPEPDPHLQTTRLQHDDRLLLCSDGLSDTVSNEEIGEALGMDPDRAADALLALALQRGASDNVSLVIARLSARST